MIPDTLEKSLNGGYPGLYGEVVTHDCYRLRKLKFTPDLIFDIGANVGVFTRFAQILFPLAQIVAVEPDPTNCAVFHKFTPDFRRIHLQEAALGKGQIFHGLTACNGSGETYLSAGLGYPEDMMRNAVTANQGMELSSVRAHPLQDLVSPFLRADRKTVMKIDCEGAENVIWEDELSMAILRSMDYLCMEVHFYALTGVQSLEVRQATHRALRSLSDTHDCELDGVHFWATRKIYDRKTIDDKSSAGLVAGSSYPPSGKRR